MKYYIRPLIICFICIFICISVFFGIKYFFINNYNVKVNAANSFVQAVTKESTDVEYRTTIETLPQVDWMESDGEAYTDSNQVYSLEHPPYEVAPAFNDDGSIVYDGKTLTELTEKINRVYVNSYLKNTGYFFANFSKKTGINPYLLVAITIAEQGCNTTCTPASITHNNFVGMLYYSGGVKYHIHYDTLDEGLNAYFNNVQRLYNSYSEPQYTVEELAGRWNPAGGQWYIDTLYRWIDYVKNK